jgi:hypothetical protein
MAMACSTTLWKAWTLCANVSETLPTP